MIGGGGKTAPKYSSVNAEVEAGSQESGAGVGSQEGNTQHPTSNIQHPTQRRRGAEVWAGRAVAGIQGSGN
jgi:hypothetical protein